MSKWKSHSVLGLAVLLAVACSKSETESDTATSSSDQISAPSSAEEAIEKYLGSLEELVEIARNTTDEATAKENAPIFEQKARELSELGEALSDIDPVELRSEFMDEHSQVTQLTAELGKEMVRISTDPALVMVMSNAMRAYRGQ